MPSPTQSAEGYFETANSNLLLAQNHRRNGKLGDYDMSVALGLQQTTAGLKQLSIGVRATYMLLEEVKQMLARQSP